jgi:hypothetical protein
MFFKNKSTGLVWEVSHPDHIKRCLKDENYQEVKLEKPKKDTPKQRKQSPKEGE